MFTIQFSTGGSAFSEEEGGNYEVARILRKIADGVEEWGDDCGKIIDINGNLVGSFCWDRD